MKLWYSTKRILQGALALLTILAMTTASARASIVYSNDFETNTDGFNVSNTEILPSDASGSASTYLGHRTPGSTSAVLTLSGLTVGTVYDIAFDLYIGGTWDGSFGFGPDTFSLVSSSAGTLVNATFRNGFPIGNPTPFQTYSDATPLGDGEFFPTREGADVELGEPIYFFGHGAGNPFLSFTALSSVEILTFQSHDGQTGTNDEFFALDNVVVSGMTVVPIPAALWLFGAGVLSLTAVRRNRASAP